jgi:hypothetical protein
MYLAARAKVVAALTSPTGARKHPRLQRNPRLKEVVWDRYDQNYLILW